MLLRQQVGTRPARELRIDRGRDLALLDEHYAEDLQLRRLRTSHYEMYAPDVVARQRLGQVDDGDLETMERIPSQHA